jgi:hypothetical protein
MTVHKATPIHGDSFPTVGTVVDQCAVCNETIMRVPGGQGATWVHEATGAVAGPDPKDEDRPNSVLAMLWEVAEWLDLADRAFEALARLQGQEYPLPQDGVQQDLRRISQWMSGHPEVDEQIYKDITGR